MNNKSFLLVAGTIFLLVAVAHLLRIINVWEVTIGNWSVPMWLSGVVVVALGYLAYRGLKAGK